MWDLPGPGLEPMSPASAGGFFLTTVPPGKSLGFILGEGQLVDAMPPVYPIICTSEVYL